MKLTAAQRRSLEGLARTSCDDRTAHAYGVSLVACRALAAAGLVVVVDRAAFSSRRGCRWRAEITDAGRAVLGQS